MSGIEYPAGAFSHSPQSADTVEKISAEIDKWLEQYSKNSQHENFTCLELLYEVFLNLINPSRNKDIHSGIREIYIQIKQLKSYEGIIQNEDRLAFKNIQFNFYRYLFNHLSENGLLYQNNYRSFVTDTIKNLFGLSAALANNSSLDRQNDFDFKKFLIHLLECYTCLMNEIAWDINQPKSLKKPLKPVRYKQMPISIWAELNTGFWKKTSKDKVQTEPKNILEEWLPLITSLEKILLHEKGAITDQDYIIYEIFGDIYAAFSKIEKMISKKAESQYDTYTGYYAKAFDLLAPKNKNLDEADSDYIRIAQKMMCLETNSTENSEEKQAYSLLEV